MTTVDPIIKSTSVQHGGMKMSIRQKPALIGRAQDCDFQYDERTKGISRHHCKVSWNPQGNFFVVEDLGSSYGTYLERNGMRLEPHKQYRIPPGEIIFLADRENTIQLIAKPVVVAEKANILDDQMNSATPSRTAAGMRSVNSQQQAVVKPPYSGREPGIVADKTQIDALKSFVKAAYFRLIVPGLSVLFLAFLIIVSVVISIDGDGKALAVGALWLLFFIGAMERLIRKISDVFGVNKQVEKYTQEGKINDVLQDFQSAEKFLDNHLYIGREYVFGKEAGKILEILEISRVYQYVHKTNFAEDRRLLIAETISGGKIALAKLKRYGKSSDELTLIVSRLLEKNPNIQVGYHGF